LESLVTTVPAKCCDSREDDYRFYNVLGGEKTHDKYTILNKCLILFGMKAVALSGERKGSVLEPKAFQHYTKLLFYVFKLKGIRYNWKKDFWKQGEFHGVMVQLWDDIRKIDPLFGTGCNQAHFDEEADEKIREAIRTGKLDPWNNPEHCQCVCVFIVGRYFGLRGMGEITHLRFELVGFGFFGPKHGSLNGLKFYVIRVPFDKTNKLSLCNVTTCPTAHQYIKVCGDPSDKVLDPVKFLDFYFSKCHPESTRFFDKIATEKQKLQFQKEGLGDIWYKNAQSDNTNSVVGINAIRTMTKKVAEIAGFENWEKCTNHGNRAHALTKMIENGAPLEDRMIFMRRHKSANSQQPYARPTAKREANRHLALRADNNNDLKPPAAPRQEAVVPQEVTKGVLGF